MRAASLDVLAVGNAMLDVLVRTEDAWLAAQGIEMGVMTLVGEAQAAALHGKVAPAAERSGGSAANTAAGLASLGGRAGYIGRVRDDEAGAAFRRDIRAAGVHFETPAALSGAATGRCLVFVTPDAERSMLTMLGAAAEIEPADIDEDAAAAATVTYLEGYLWDAPAAKAAMVKLADAARTAGRKVALTLSDPFCVARHRETFLDLIVGRVDILFANEEEILSLTGGADLQEAANMIVGMVETAALTRGAEGALVVSGKERQAVPAAPVARLADTTGAGDLYAAGFLHAYTRLRPLAECAWLGSLAAARIIEQMGARPTASLAGLPAAAVAGPSLGALSGASPGASCAGM